MPLASPPEQHVQHPEQTDHGVKAVLAVGAVAEAVFDLCDKIGGEFEVRAPRPPE